MKPYSLMETYKITVWYDNDVCWSKIEKEIDFQFPTHAREHAEHIAQVGVWDEAEGIEFLIGPALIRKITVEVLDV